LGEMLPGASPSSRSPPALSEETTLFHEHGTFAALWLLVIFVGIVILKEARDILEPLLWAFFLVNILVPLTNMIEKKLQWIFRCGRPRIGKRDRERERAPTGSARSQAGELTSYSSELQARESEVELELPIGSHRRIAKLNGKDDRHESDDESDDSDDGQGCAAETLNLARPLAVAMVIVGTVGAAALFCTMVYRSAEHMKEDFHHYKNGSEIITLRIKEYMKAFPEDKVAQFTKNALKKMEGILSSILTSLIEATTGTAVEMLWIGLYMVFWLCQPFHVGREVSTVFRRYVFLKGVASASYAFFIWILLHFLRVDLAIVFGIITFVLNFIPEIGPFIAMMLPLPVILFDDRMTRPVECMLLALMGQMGLKVIFGNVIEIKLIESQQEMRMHPVIILFFVAFFQLIWGATGMLLSVPIVAALKATLHKIPPFYRDSILVFLEGDQLAPKRWRRWRASLQEEVESTPDSSQGGL